jgi:hypothetical protein
MDIPTLSLQADMLACPVADPYGALADSTLGLSDGLQIGLNYPYVYHF